MFTNKNSLLADRTYTFIFPIKTVEQHEYGTIQDIMEALKAQSEQMGQQEKYSNLYIKKKYPTVQDPKFFSLVCRYCSARIQYRRKNLTNWKMTNFNNEHVHKSQQLKDISKQVRQYILENIDMPKDTMFLKLRQNFNIRKTKLVSLVQQVKQFKREFEYFCHYAKKNDLFLDYYDQQGETYPDAIVFISPEMKSLYKKYGDVIAYETQHNRLTNLNKDGLLYTVGVLSGWNTCNNGIIFGVVMYVHVQDQIKLLKRFFQEVGSSSCMITKSDKEPLIRKLTKSNSFTGLHILDVKQIIEYASLNLQMLNDKQKLDALCIIKKVLTQNNQNIACQKLEKFINSIQNTVNNKKVINFLLDNTTKLCLWAINKTFLGLYRDTNNSLFEIFKNYDDNKQIGIMDFVIKVVEFSTERFREKFQQECYLYENVLLDPKLKELRTTIGKKVFACFLKQYVKAYRYVRKTQNTIQHLESEDLFKVDSERMSCDCGYLQKTGIPCQHLIYVIKERQKLDYSSFFSERWKHKSSNLKVQNQTNPKMQSEPNGTHQEQQIFVSQEEDVNSSGQLMNS